MTAIFTIILSISLIVVLFFFTNNIVSTFAENSIENSQGDWTKYINQTYGFSLEYPSSWVIKEYQQNKDIGIFDFMIGQLTKNISYENFTGFFAFRSFGESGFSFGSSQFSIMPIDDIGFLTDIVKNIVRKIIIENYNLNLTFLNDSKIQKLSDEEIGTFTFQIDDPIKDIFITTIVTNHNNNTRAFFILGTQDQLKNSYILENFNHMLNSIKWLDKNSKSEASINNNSRINQMLYSDLSDFYFLE